MKISVVIAVHNGERYIGRAIRSVLDQSLSRDNYEIIVVDDGSSDNTLQVLNSFGDWIRVIQLEEQHGLPFACNEGIRKALGRYVVRVDADDYIHEDLLKVERLYLNLNADYDAVACDYYLVNQKEEHIGRRNAENNPIACGIMFRKDQLIDIGLYDEDFLLLEEVELRIRFLEKYNIHRIELPLYRYRQHDKNITKDKKALAHYRKKLEEKHGGKV